MFKIIKSENYSWANINEVNEENLARIKKLFRVHPLDIEDIRADIHDPKLDVYKNYIFSVFNLPQYNKKTGRVERHDLDVFIGKDFLVTVHKTNLEEIDEFFKKLEKNSVIRKETLGKGADFLLFKVLQLLFKAKMNEPVSILSGRLSEVENGILEEKGRENIKELAGIRRNVLLLRRMVEPQRFFIHSLAADKGGFVNPEFVPYFDDLRDYLEKIWVRLESFKDTIDGLYNTMESLLGYKTNEIIKTLTVISVSLMPMTLLAGIFGMNINLPFVDRPEFVWSMFIGLSLIVSTIIIVLKKWKWF